jgi:hypothetical protein
MNLILIEGVNGRFRVRNGLVRDEIPPSFKLSFSQYGCQDLV